MKVLILTNHCGRLYLFRKLLLVRLLETHRVFVSVPEDAYTEPVKALGCEVIPCKLMDRRGINPLTEYQLYRHYQHLLQKIQPDIVLTYTIKSNIYGGYACRKSGIPYLATVTGLGSVFEGDGFFDRMMRRVVVMMYRAAMKECHCLFFQNEDNLKTFHKHGIYARKERLVNGSGVDLEEFSGTPMPVGGDGKTAPPVRFVFIARILREKGIEEYLSAAARIKKKYPQTEFHVCGFKEKEYRGRLDKAVAKNIVIYHGERDDMPSFLKVIHCVALPSYHEGLSNVLLESAASGRVLVTSDIPGCREAVEDGVTGFLIPPRDANALADAMERFLSLSHEARTEMGRQARQKMEREFDRRKVTDVYMKEINRWTTT
ncbi:MAG: glycosyltransferase family 4 protein [Lachnospiraceae bacterium]|nr:glycosyltransferase family 4 protein [Lachnospiraceae bacterium]